MSDPFQSTLPSEHHEHEALLHDHRHFHVTHNHNRLTGGFDHLYSEHSHSHDHAAVAHSHVPHQDFDSEHAGEAHVHDHLDPTHRQEEAVPDVPATAKKAAKRATGVKKSARRAAPADG
ncbi:MAG TPA: hypothetical protein VFV35_00380 [Acidimicrobiales bacterium]|nr:hypothetical protein [Acidimicrobiales bacterium]